MVETKKLLRALIDIDVIPGSHDDVYSFLKEKPVVEKVIVTFGKPDVTAFLKVEDLKHLYSVVNEITRHPSMAKTNTRIVVPEEFVTEKRLT